MRHYIRFRHSIVLFMYLLLCSCLDVFAGNVSLEWDPSVSEGVVGYKVYFGNSSHSYNSSQTVGNQSTYTITGLPEGTYYLAVTALDAAGNESGYSNEVSTTVAAIPPIDTTPPVISSVSASVITENGATISWETNEPSTSRVEYGPTTQYGGTTNLNTSIQTSHFQELSGLIAGTLYHYRVLSMDEEGNLAMSADYTFETSQPIDTTPPVISSVAASGITTNGATISWTTNELSTSRVEYGPTTEYGDTTNLNTSMQRTHSQELSGLSAGTSHHYRVSSMDEEGNLALSADYTFETSQPIDTTPPVISSIIVAGQTDSEATITWTTNEPSDSQIEYGTTAEYGSSTTLDNTLTNSHAQTLTGLEPDSEYHFRIHTKDRAGNLALSEDHTFNTMNIVNTLVMPSFGDGLVSQNNELYLGMVIMNTGFNPATVRVTAFDENGNIISGDNITNPVVRNLNAGEQISLVDVEIFGTSLTDIHTNGWIELSSTTDQVQGLATWFDMQRQLMDSVPFQLEPLTDFTFTDIESDGKTRISLINRNTDACSINIDLVKANGDIRSSIRDTIEGNEVWNRELYTGIFAGVAPDSTDYLRISASNGVIPFQVMQHETADISFAYGQDISAASTTAYALNYIPDDNSQTTFTIVNLDSTAGNVKIRFVGKDGIQIGATRDIQVYASEKLTIDSQEFFLDPAYVDKMNSSKGKGRYNGNSPWKYGEKLSQNTSLPEIDGYVEIVTDGIRIVGSASYRGGSKKQSFMANLPLVPNLYEKVRFNYLASDDLYFTDIAIANPGNSDASVTLDLYNNGGALVDTARISVPPGQQLRHSLSEYFNTLQGVSQIGGHVNLSSSLPVATFSLFGTNNLSAISALPGQKIE